MKLNINELLARGSASYEKFHQKTMFNRLAKEVSSKYWPEEWKKIFYKGYPRLTSIELPSPKSLNKKTFEQILSNRSSVRSFSTKKMTLQSLSTVLTYGAGLNEKRAGFEARYYPSAGARYPLEVYVLSLNSEIPQGVYHYNLKNHALEELDTFDKFNFNKYFNIPWVKNAGCILLITAIIKRNTMKYGDRGYRHVLSECGHLSQNIYLISSALDLGCCSVGGYSDRKLNELLDINGVNETVIASIVLGEQQVDNLAAK